MIHLKDGGVSFFKKLYEFNPNDGDTFLSKDGTILVFVMGSNRVDFIRLDGTFNPRTLNPSTIADVTMHHTFKRVDVEITIKAVA